MIATPDPLEGPTAIVLLAIEVACGTIGLGDDGAWLESVYPSLPLTDRPLECVQLPNDVIYVPAGWHHAVLNIGETAGASWRNASQTANKFDDNDSEKESKPSAGGAGGSGGSKKKRGGKGKRKRRRKKKATGR